MHTTRRRGEINGNEPIENDRKRERESKITLSRLSVVERQREDLARGYVVMSVSLWVGGMRRGDTE
jgi:hypothetical protein